MRPVLVALFLLALTQAQAQTPNASDIQAGSEIWQGYVGLQNDCKLCHGDHGQGGFAKPLAGHQLTAAQFLHTVRQGAGKTMPAKSGRGSASGPGTSRLRAFNRPISWLASANERIRAS